jgi:hypothetical protein
MRWLSALVVIAVVLPVAVPACAAVPVSAAADEEPDIEFFYPVVTRRPVIERELEITTRYEKSGASKLVESALGLEWPVVPWWQIELEVPLVINLPGDSPSTAGVGDIAIENKLRLWKSVEHGVLVAGGVELTLPSGSARRGLGGELALEPFLTAGIALDHFDLLGSLAYEWRLNGPDRPREQEFSANVALAYRLSRWFTPFLEANLVLLTTGPRTDDPTLVGRPQLYLTPGFNVRPLPGVTLRAGVQLPVTSARELDYAVHAGLIWEF